MNGADLIAPLIAFAILLYFALHIPWSIRDERRRVERQEDVEALKQLLRLP